MAITYISEAGVAGGFQTSPIVVNYNSTAGNTLILNGFLYYSSVAVPGITNITDSAGNTWHFSTSASQNPPYSVDPGNSNNSVVWVAWCINAAPISSVTFSMSSSSPWVRMTLSEWSGIAALDSCAAATSLSGSAPTAALTLTGTNDLVVGAIENNQGSPTISIPPGWTEFNSAGPTPNVAFGTAASSGPYSPAYSLSSPSDWNIAVAAFRSASATPPNSFMPFFQ